MARDLLVVQILLLVLLLSNTSRTPSSALITRCWGPARRGGAAGRNYTTVRLGFQHPALARALEGTRSKSGARLRSDGALLAPRPSSRDRDAATTIPCCLAQRSSPTDMATMIASTTPS
jgi:hypothetical protein